MIFGLFAIPQAVLAGRSSTRMAYHFRDPLLRRIRETAVELGDLNETSTKTIKLHPKSKELTEFLREALARVPFLYGVHLHQILRFTEAMEHCRLLPREVAVREGSTIDYLYVVHTGRVLVQSLNTKRMLGPGDTFGQEALDTGGRADFTAIGQGSAELYRLHRQVFKLMQMEYGTRLRMTIWSVIEQNRKAKGPSAFQGVVTQAMTRHKDIKSLSESSYDGYESLAREFADVPAAVTQSSSVAILGKGQFGEVHLIVHMPTRKAYALKIQDSAGMNGRTPLRTLIDREIACMREGASPFLMRFYGETTQISDDDLLRSLMTAHDPLMGLLISGEYVDAQKKSYMLLEHLGGGSLEDLMADHRGGGAMSLHTVRFYFACMCAAFDALHSAAWMHRDLSAKNVMISRRGYCKVIDVGLAKRVSESEHTYTSCGTPLYLAPEIIHKTGCT